MPGLRVQVRSVPSSLCAVVAVSRRGADASAGAAEGLFHFLLSPAATPLPNGIELRDGDLVMQITALRDDVLRIRASGNGHAARRCDVGSAARGTERVGQRDSG